MSTRYEAIAPPRYRIETVGSGERIRIKPRRELFPLLFLPVWLAGWTAGGVLAISELIQNFSAFLMFWLCGWAIGWVFAASTLAWMVWGSQTLAVVGRDLEVATQIGRWTRRKIYQGSQIHDLRVGETSAFQQFHFDGPLMGGLTGPVRFDYGARTIRVGGGLDEAEAKSLVVRLAKALPQGARSPTSS